MHIFRNLRFRTALFHHLFALGTNHDAVQSSLCQRPVNQFSLIRGARELCPSFLGQDCKLYLSVQNVPTEAVVLVEELLNDERYLL